VLVFALAAGLVRLLPWLMSEEVPVRVAGPFAAALTAAAAETACLVGIPLGFALGAAIFVERGEARALLSLGQSPLAISLRAWPMLAAFTFATITTSLAFGPEANRPGDFARRLIDGGKKSCAEVQTARSVLVPMVGVTWLCFPNRPPRVTGTVPSRTLKASFTASEIIPNADLRRLNVSDLRVVARAPSWPELRLRVRSATVSGMRPWGRSTSLSPLARAALMAASAACVSFVLAWLVLHVSLGARLLAATAGAGGGLSMLAVLNAVDRAGGPKISYLAVPLIGMAVAIALVFAGKQAERLLAGVIWRAQTR
jgi:hypothetical protein